MCVCVCVCVWHGAIGWYWGHRVSGVCYGTEMNITEQEEQINHVCSHVLKCWMVWSSNCGRLFICLFTWCAGILLASWTMVIKWFNVANQLRNVYKHTRTILAILKYLLIFHFSWKYTLCMENNTTAGNIFRISVLWMFLLICINRKYIKSYSLSFILHIGEIEYFFNIQNKC